MNGRYLRELDAGAARRELLEERTGRGVPPRRCAIAQEKMQTLADFWPLAGFLVEPQETDEKAWGKVMGDGAPERLQPRPGRRSRPSSRSTRRGSRQPCARSSSGSG